MAIVKAERVRYFSHFFSDAKNKENFTGTNFRKPNFGGVGLGHRWAGVRLGWFGGCSHT